MTDETLPCPRCESDSVVVTVTRERTDYGPMPTRTYAFVVEDPPTRCPECGEGFTEDEVQDLSDRAIRLSERAYYAGL